MGDGFKMDDIDEDYLIKVVDYMDLSELKHMSDFIWNYGEFLPIITVECEVWIFARIVNMLIIMLPTGGILGWIQSVV